MFYDWILLSNLRFPTEEIVFPCLSKWVTSFRKKCNLCNLLCCVHFSEINIKKVPSCIKIWINNFAVAGCHAMLWCAFIMCLTVLACFTDWCNWTVIYHYYKWPDHWNIFWIYWLEYTNDVSLLNLWNTCSFWRKYNIICI